MKPTMRYSRLVAIALAAATLPTLSCSTEKLLDANTPDLVTPESLEGQPGLATLRAGAIGDFTYAFSGGSSVDNLAINGGLLADEFLNAETFPTRIEMDRRNIDTRNTTLTAMFRNVERARVSTENAATQIQAISTTPATDSRISEMLGLAGFTYTLIGENYCSGVPFSTASVTGTLDYGDPQTTAQIYGRAIAKFDSALNHPGASATTLNLARIGKGRVQLDLGQFAAAATTVGAVPTNYVYRMGHSINSTRQENGIYTLNTKARRFALAELDGNGNGALVQASGALPAGATGQGLNFRTAGDPRITWSRTPATRVGFDNGTPFFDQLKYPDENASVTLADGVEARLIEAEAFLQAANFASWLATLNTLRTTVTGLAPLADPGTQTGREDLMFRERAFWLFATAHRLSDLRRMVRQYGRAVNTVFPSGTYFKGGVYGTDVNFPVPFDELNNPKSTGCIDRNP